MFDKNFLESFVCSSQPLLRYFCIYLLLNNITFESHQRRKKTKVKQLSSAWVTTRNSCFQLLSVVSTFIEEPGYQQKVKNLNMLMTRKPIQRFCNKNNE